MTRPKDSSTLTSVVDKREAGERLDLFMVHAVSALSRKRAKKLIDARLVSVNGRIEPMASRTMKSGDRVEIRIPALGADMGAPPELSVLYEDDFMVAVDKGPGLVSGPTRDPNRVHAQKVAEALTGRKLTLLHRLDRDTSGILLLASDTSVAKALLASFKKREIEKTYLAIVTGKTPRNFSDVCHLKETKTGRAIVVKSGGMRSETDFSTLKTMNGCSLVVAAPHTGRMHQIRVQLTRLGFPILGDSLYGGAAKIVLEGKSKNLEITRQLLHAWKISFFHPGLEKEMKLECPLPEDFGKALKTLFGPVKI